MRRARVQCLLHHALVLVIARLQPPYPLALLLFERSEECALFFDEFSTRLLGATTFRGCRGSVAILVFHDRESMLCYTLNTILLV